MTEQTQDTPEPKADVLAAAVAGALTELRRRTGELERRVAALEGSCPACRKREGRNG